MHVIGYFALGYTSYRLYWTLTSKRRNRREAAKYTSDC